MRNLDPKLFTDVTAKVKLLKVQVEEAEWEGHSDAERLRRELGHYERLLADGTLFEPKF